MLTGIGEARHKEAHRSSQRANARHLAVFWVLDDKEGNLVSSDFALLDITIQKYALLLLPEFQRRQKLLLRVDVEDTEMVNKREVFVCRLFKHLLDSDLEFIASFRGVVETLAAVLENRLILQCGGHLERVM